MDARDVLIEAFGRLPDLVRAAVEGLDPERLRYRPAERANSVGWLVWHLARVQDSHIAELIGADEVYRTGGWAPKFGLDAGSSDTGYGHTPAEVARIAPASWEVLTGYYDAVHERTIDFLAGLTADDLDRVVDEAWDPPVTMGVRLVSVYDDDTQHVGQAAYLRGLL